MLNISQKTINSKVSCNSIGLHSGANVKMMLLPAPCNSGIIFRRSDVESGKNEIKAHYKNVVATNLGTTISNEFGTKVATIEHLMAAIWGCGIDNLIVELNAEEIPIMDGSSAPFVFLIECAGINVQGEQRRIIEVLKKIRVEEKDKFVEIEPAKEFAVDLHIDFDNKKILQQRFDYHSTMTSFKNDISRARTFCFKHEIDHMHKLGLAKGGSLNNAIVVDENGVVNKDGLRYEDEFVRHKTLDFLGDMYLASYFIIGHFKTSKPGHSINNKFLHEFLMDEDGWRLV
ncbi:MAG: UDP-3-O-[3-hydroxymyristoyl] N-acetylglucosamine deacetylase [Alphaproteobacteria bacterium RIFCSPLOWO2_01_FULL_40_26]|nr:MAG: UDP-3-O-[3-hydroxymyristoyl] N-acetylglucosamine deacetylase [Alphaproteobacteria bacterium RIFCSPHIGHO2_02_FULL_40_34]OFW93946.1 MAG: UDP-3-O-[3-hydroxymyristoyl] N-acetylglucosamine deacetylase [Alphaproteobacteria bacterium RIFCSPLOWO2_01_FULL_40_26]OFX09658.1 MAG: UDP-3-O-[3-hydroxymyristoyl] N-acetylglucosamine deacetylase [Alphaproteobacteria bacterium RIFCSPLOWO2_02_FULL_40_19]OFX11987.1 MAG: UDP-3-O-[3-hydroxymyristoyl] N-acetylglucosamine deacetylase [Alphaproteobacteria bacteri